MRMAARRSMTTSTSTWNFEERKRTDGPFFSRYFNTNAAHQEEERKKTQARGNKTQKNKNQDQISGCFLERGFRSFRISLGRLFV